MRTILIAAVAGLWLALLGDARADALRVERVTLTVSDLERSEAFYRDGLGFERVGSASYDDEAYARLLGVAQARVRTRLLRLGSEEIELQQVSPPGRAYWSDSRSPDLWFQHFAIVVADMPSAFERLRRVDFTPISDGGPQTLPPQNGRVQAFKFRDPDGHPLELLHFPRGVGREIWHRGDARQVFLGIDHTAIGVSDTPRSVAFYRQGLGLQSVYEVVNRGPAQERLDGTFNAVVQITGLWPRDGGGPGIEFLDYRAPGTGRPAPRDSAANDVAHAHTTIRVDGLQEMAEELFVARATMISPGVVAVDRQIHGFDHGLMVRDPDGHALLLVE